MEHPFTHNYDGLSDPLQQEGDFSGDEQQAKRKETREDFEKDSRNKRRIHLPGDTVHIPLDSLDDEGVLHLRAQPERVVSLSGLLDVEAIPTEEQKAAQKEGKEHHALAPKEFAAPTPARPSEVASLRVAESVKENKQDVQEATRVTAHAQEQVTQATVNTPNQAVAQNQAPVQAAPNRAPAPARAESSPSGTMDQDAERPTAASATENGATGAPFNAEKPAQKSHEALAAAEAAVVAALAGAKEQEASEDIKEVSSTWHNVKIHEKTGQIVEQDYGRAFAEEQRAERQPAAQTNSRKDSRGPVAGAVAGVVGLLAGARNPSLPSPKKEPALSANDSGLSGAQKLLPAGRQQIVSSLNSPWFWLILGLLLVVWFGRSLFS